MSVLSDEFEKWWKAVSNDEHVPIGIEDRHVARIAWVAAIAADRAARTEPDGCVQWCPPNEVVQKAYADGWNACVRIMRDTAPPAAPASDQVAAAVKAERERIYALIDTNPEHIWRDAGFMQWRAKRSQESE